MPQRHLPLGGLILGLLLPFAVAAPALAGNYHLPTTYKALRIDAPTPTPGAKFGEGLLNVGDLNGDTKDDILVADDKLGASFGRVHLISGANGAVIRTINAPDPDTRDGQGNRTAFGAYIGRFPDIGGCPHFAGRPGEDCTEATITEIDTPDGVPDLLLTAPGVDVTPSSNDDTGRAYVIDGKTGAVLKRIDMPAADRDAQAAVDKNDNLKGSEPGAGAKPGFGRTILSPAAQPPCAGNQGIGPCDTVTPSVKTGDLTGDGIADIVIGAPHYYETSATNSACTSTCRQAGRIYVYSGAMLAGHIPSNPLSIAQFTIKNPLAQADNVNDPTYSYPEHFGDSLSPVGDIGRCTGPASGPIFCINDPNPSVGQASNVPDDKPEFVAGGSRTDVAGMFDVGQSYIFDGPTGRIIQFVSHPEPQPASIFGYANYNQPAPGNLADTVLPDVYTGAIEQTIFFKGQGRGYVINGNIKTDANRATLGVLEDPTPFKVGNFGTSAAGIGNLLDDDPRKEVIVGASGPSIQSVPVINDITIFSPLTEEALQRIEDPDQQQGSGFGSALAPMGDLNDDTFLDFVVGAPGWEPPGSSNQGRVYIMMSDNSPPPPPPDTGSSGGTEGPPGLDGAEGPEGPAGPRGRSGATLLGRSIEFDVSKTRIRAGGQVKVGGVVASDDGKSRCQAQQPVVLQRRKPGIGGRFVLYKEANTSRSGAYSIKIKPSRTYLYRALVRQSKECVGAVSQREKVTVAVGNGKGGR